MVAEIIKQPVAQIKLSKQLLGNFQTESCLQNTCNVMVELIRSIGASMEL